MAKSNDLSTTTVQMSSAAGLYHLLLVSSVLCCHLFILSYDKYMSTRAKNGSAVEYFCLVLQHPIIVIALFPRTVVTHSKQ